MTHASLETGSIAIAVLASLLPRLGRIWWRWHQLRKRGPAMRAAGLTFTERR